MDQTQATRTPALTYDGKLGELYGIFLMNLLWTVLTLGIFKFWAVTRLRRYLWSHTRFQGERFEYTGTGGELFVGYLLAMLSIIGAAVAAGILGVILYYTYQPLTVLAVFVFYGWIALLAAGAIFSAQRYRLSRTLWAGIRGGMTGSMLAYGARSIGYGILTMLTLFQMAPWRAVRLAEHRINASSLGSLRFTFRGRAREVYVPFLLTYLATLALFAVIGYGVWTAVQGYLPLIQETMAQDGPRAPMSREAQAALLRLAVIGYGSLFLFSIGAGLIRFWYVALFERHVIGNSTLGPLRFSSTITGRGLLWLFLGNVLILLFTLGLGLPIVIQRDMRFLARNLQVSGGLDLPSLVQGSMQQPRMAEGMFQVLDGGGAF